MPLQLLRRCISLEGMLSDPCVEPAGTYLAGVKCKLTSQEKIDTLAQ